MDYMFLGQKSRAVPSAIIGGDAYSYIRVLPDGFILKAIVFTVQYMNPSPPKKKLSRLGTALQKSDDK